MEIERKDIIKDYADLSTNGNSSHESMLLAEIIKRTREGGYILYIDFYNSAPQDLGISKDSYRKSMASLKRKGLISKKGYCIQLKNHDNLIKSFTEITLKQQL